jgi:hypothetical protein
MRGKLIFGIIAVLSPQMAIPQANIGTGGSTGYWRTTTTIGTTTEHYAYMKVADSTVPGSGNGFLDLSLPGIREVIGETSEQFWSPEFRPITTVPDLTTTPPSEVQGPNYFAVPFSGLRQPYAGR